MRKDTAQVVINSITLLLLTFVVATALCEIFPSRRAAAVPSAPTHVAWSRYAVAGEGWSIVRPVTPADAQPDSIRYVSIPLRPGTEVWMLKLRQCGKR